MTATLDMPRDMLLSGTPEGLDALAVAGMAAEGGASHPVLHVVRDDRRLEAAEAALKFFDPGLLVVSFPAWDCVPYDRSSPNSDIVARRIAALARIGLMKRDKPMVVLATVNALLQRVPGRKFLRETAKVLAPDQRLDMGELRRSLEIAGYVHTSTVMERGEYAVRGHIVDLFPPGRTSPVRLDFFGDTIETIKPFDPQTQRTAKSINRANLLPISEASFGDAAISRFRTRYVELFGAVNREDPLYESVSAGQRFPGLEHWLPLFHETLDTLLDYLPGASIVLDHLTDEAVKDRFEQVTEHYQARVDALEQTTFGAPPYKPLPPSRLYLDDAEWRKLLAAHPVRRLSPFEAPDDARAQTVSLKAKVGRNFAAERQVDSGTVFDAVVAHIGASCRRRASVSS